MSEFTVTETSGLDSPKERFLEDVRKLADEFNRNHGTVIAICVVFSQSIDDYDIVRIHPEAPNAAERRTHFYRDTPEVKKSDNQGLLRECLQMIGPSEEDEWARLSTEFDKCMDRKFGWWGIGLEGEEPSGEPVDKRVGQAVSETIQRLKSEKGIQVPMIFMDDEGIMNLSWRKLLSMSFMIIDDQVIVHLVKVIPFSHTRVPLKDRLFVYKFSEEKEALFTTMFQRLKEKK